MEQWTVPSPQRLDAFLVEQYPDVSRSRLQKAIEEGFVEVNAEEVLKSSWKVKARDQVTLLDDWDAVKESTHIDPADLAVPVLYEDDDCMVVNKPAGYAVHPGSGMAPGEKTMLNAIAFLFHERSLPFSTDAVLVHRLDKETTGCLLIAKNAKAHGALQQQFEDRTVSKTYLAIVAGVPNPPKAVIDAPIGRNLNDRTKMSVLRTSRSREAKTTYRVLDQSDSAALVECDLHTGRTHQIRVHMSSIGHPILGDPSYASSKAEALAKEHDIHSLCLHAWKLRFLSPTKVKEIVVEAPLPESFLMARNGILGA